MRRLALPLLVLALAGCLDMGGADDTRPARASVVLEQVGAVEDGVATLRLVARSSNVALSELLFAVEGEVREDATARGCPPPPDAWAWCGDPAAFRANGTLQVRATAGDVLRVVDRVENQPMMTLVLR